MSIRRLTVALALAAVSVGATASSAGAWTLSAPAAGSLNAAPTTESEFFVSVTVGTDGMVHFAPAAETLPAACNNSGGATVCPTSAVATKLEIDQAVGTSVSSIKTGTLRIVGTSSSDQWTLSNISVTGTLDVDPGGGGDDQLNATGAAGSMQLDNTAVDHGTIAMTLDTGATTGSIQLPSGHDNYVYAPNSALNVTGDGDITAGGALNGGSGNDTFHAVSVSQSIKGGGGQDAVTFARIATPLTLTFQSNDLLLNGDTSPHVLGVQDVTAGSGNDTLIGASPSGGSTTPLTLRGGPGNNLFIPMGGPENVDGAPGNTLNTVSYADLPDSTPLTVDLSAGVGGPTGASPDQLDQLTNINGVIGNNGTDTITGGSQGGTFVLGNGSNTMTGGPENDTIQAGSGTDNVNGGGGNDTIMGGSGNDTLIAGPGNNQIQAGSGTTLIQDSGGDNTLVGGSGKDTVSYANRTAGQGVVVTLNGNSGSTGNGQPGENDTITGIENIIGSAGDDVLNGDSNANTIQAGSGNPVINSGDGNDTIIGGSGNDTINAGKGINTITTGNGENIVNANSAQGSVINCGSGFNNVTVSKSVVTNGCQLVSILGAAPFVPPPTLLNASLGKVVTKQLSRGFTVFKRLDVSNVPGETSVSITCQALANVCPTHNPESLNFNSGRSTLHLVKFLKSVGFEVPAKTKLTIVVIGGPNTIGKQFVVTTRSQGAPKTSVACLKPRTTQNVVSTPGGFSTRGGGNKTMKCPAAPKSASDASRANVRHTSPETQQQRQQAAAVFAAASAQIGALVGRDAAALALVK